MIFSRSVRMGKKERNIDGSKKKQLVIEEYFEGNATWELLKGCGGSSNGLEWCSYCEVEVPINPKTLSIHFTSKKHKNREIIHNLLPLFASYGIMRMGNHKEFYCEEHGVLEAKFTFLINHLIEHPKFERVVFDEKNEHDFQDLVVKVFRQKLWMVDLQSTSARLNRQLSTYSKIQAPVTLRDDSPVELFLANLKNGIFTKGEISMLKKVASYLETKGDNVDRSEAIQSSKISAFGMRWSMGDTGWYRYKHIDVQSLALELVEFVFDRLQIHYPCVFQHLHKILHSEGFSNGEASFGRSPFTSFVVARDYNVRPHLDQDDYDLGFIIWFHEDHVGDDEEVSLFTFPEFRIGFNPKDGDVLCFQASSLYHCTRALEKRNHLGLAFFQKASLLRHLKKLLDLPLGGHLEVTIPRKGKSVAKSITEKKADFEKKKITYERELCQGKFSLSDFY